MIVVAAVGATVAVDDFDFVPLPSGHATVAVELDGGRQLQQQLVAVELVAAAVVAVWHRGLHFLYAVPDSNLIRHRFDGASSALEIDRAVVSCVGPNDCLYRAVLRGLRVKRAKVEANEYKEFAQNYGKI